MSRITLTGENLKIDDIVQILSDEGSLDMSSIALKKVNKARKFLERQSSKRVIYGVNTGFGPMASHIIGPRNLKALQKNLILSHAVGIGEPIERNYVLASMIVRLNTLAKGFSGVSSELLRRLQFFINKKIVPIIPEHGAVGTSGDLVQLAHIALALLGGGYVSYNDDIIRASEILKKFGIRPYELKSKEGLALINGTSVMSGIGAVICGEAENILNLSTRIGALSLELVSAFDDGISESLHNARPHPGQKKIARQLRSLLSSSKLLRKRDAINRHNNGNEGYETHEIPEEVQEIYSLRCIPQILGPVNDALNKTKKDIEIEINSVSDNPIIDLKNKQFLHGGNFHGDYIAVALDQLKASFVKLTMLSERRINFFLNRKANKLLPPFLNMKVPGLNLALQGLQFVATSTTSQSQSLAFPHNIHSIPTNADNQDIVSMGTDVALFTSKVIDNAYIVLAIELITLAQVVDIRDVKNRLSRSSRKIVELLRSVFPAVTDDRILVDELPIVVNILKKWKDRL